MAAPTTATPRPRRGDELELTVDRLAYGGNGVARREDGYVVFVAGAVPGDRVRAEVGKSKKAYAEARTVELLEPSPDRIPAVADHPGAPWQVLPYARQLEVKQEQVEDALTRIGRLEGYELEPIVPALEEWRYRNKLEYSFGTGDDGELVCGFHAPGRWDRIEPMTDCLLASERNNAVREQALAELRRQGLGAWDRRTQEGFLRNLVVREGRRTGELQVRLVTSPGKLDADALIDGDRRRPPVLDPDRRARREHPGRRDDAALRRAAAGRAARRPALPDLARRVLPDQHGDGRGALRPRRRGRRAARPRARLRPLLRHRHDRPVARHAGARGRRRRDRRGRGGRRDRERAPQRDHQRLVLRGRHPARDARARRARGQARRRGHRPAARRPLAEGRAAHHRGRARSGSSTSPATRRRSRRTPRSSSRRAGRSSACARSTCSPRRRTSSAWRCWSAHDPHPAPARDRQRLPRRGGRRPDADRHDGAPRRAEGDPRRGRQDGPPDRPHRAHARPRGPHRRARRARRRAAGRRGPRSRPATRSCWPRTSRRSPASRRTRSCAAASRARRRSRRGCSRPATASARSRSSPPRATRRARSPSSTPATARSTRATRTRASAASPPPPR